MTAAPHSPLVEKTARAIVDVRRRYNGSHEDSDKPMPDERWHEMRDWYLQHRDDPNALSVPFSLPAFGYDAAQAALSACHAEEMRVTLQLLLAAIGRLPVRIITGELTEAVLAADAVLKAVGGGKKR